MTSTTNDAVQAAEFIAVAKDAGPDVANPGQMTCDVLVAKIIHTEGEQTVDKDDDYTVDPFTDNGKIINMTVADKTITLPDSLLTTTKALNITIANGSGGALLITCSTPANVSGNHIVMAPFGSTLFGKGFKQVTETAAERDYLQMFLPASPGNAGYDVVAARGIWAKET